MPLKFCALSWCAGILGLCAVNSAWGAIVVTTSGQTDPTTKGFVMVVTSTRDGSPDGVGTDFGPLPVGVNDGGVDAWRIQRDLEDQVWTGTPPSMVGSVNHGLLNYGYNWADHPELTTALADPTGWTATVRVRVVDGGGSTSNQLPEVLFEVNEGINPGLGGVSGGRTFGVHFKPQAWSSIVPPTFSSTGGTGDTNRPAGVYTYAPTRAYNADPRYKIFDGAVPTDEYHTYQIIYDPTLNGGTAKFYMDGVHIVGTGVDQTRGPVTAGVNSAASASSIPSPRILFGDGAGQGTSDAYWAFVQFETGQRVYASLPVPGDFDFDGDVDGADFVAWQTNFPTATGATLAQGDADGDGDVDGADFVVWQTNFPFTPGPGVTSVPEPAGATFIVAATMMVAIARFRPRQ